MSTRSFLCLSTVLFLVAGVSVCASPAEADNQTAKRMERDAQVQSNNGHYTEAKQLRAIAEALRSKDSVVSRQVEADVSKGDFARAKETLRLR